MKKLLFIIGFVTFVYLVYSAITRTIQYSLYGDLGKLIYYFLDLASPGTVGEQTFLDLVYIVTGVIELAIIAVAWTGDK